MSTLWCYEVINNSPKCKQKDRKKISYVHSFTLLFQIEDLTLFTILLNFRPRFILHFKALNPQSTMPMPKSPNVVCQRPLVLEIRTTSAIPKLATILLMGSPISPHCKWLPTLSTCKGLGSMLSLVVCLESSKIFERSWPWVVYVVLAFWCTTIAWEP